MAQQINRCSCGAQWTSHSVCHRAASGCHVTFTSLSAFVLHRRGSTCAVPEDIGLVSASRKYPAYAFPGDDSRFKGRSEDDE